MHDEVWTPVELNEWTDAKKKTWIICIAFSRICCAKILVLNRIIEILWACYQAFHFRILHRIFNGMKSWKQFANYPCELQQIMSRKKKAEFKSWLYTTEKGNFNFYSIRNKRFTVKNSMTKLHMLSMHLS